MRSTITCPRRELLQVFLWKATAPEGNEVDSGWEAEWLDAAAALLGVVAEMPDPGSGGLIRVGWPDPHIGLKRIVPGRVIVSVRRDEETRALVLLAMPDE
ncbi:hypothetical protein HNP84_009772 [Thermocatellispora tengchongensis]|uniref:Uncharacterized protein n=1 Tax=Thermocatellispora tengchongensis TaxID=1073253 RepID=A0A840PSA7_9ACTN|nr:hypothetical protein [Thermocatellispora tengchongensis]MBB5140007.1 hypothetical protein [Thermocatellispora tengchongensis]